MSFSRTIELDWAAMPTVAELLGVGPPETIRKWCRETEVDAGRRPRMTAEESAELKWLQRENAELKRANAIPDTASALFAVDSTGHVADRALHGRARR